MARKVQIGILLGCIILILLLRSMTVLHVRIVGHDIIYQQSTGLKIAYINENSTKKDNLFNINTKNKGFVDTIKGKIATMKDMFKDKPSYIQVYDLKKPVSNASFPCINAKAYKPPIHICTYIPGHDIHISGMLSRNSMWEAHVHKDIVGALSRDPSLNYIDIGANIGSHTLYVAKIGRRVLAVEPVYDNFIRLHKSIVLNGLQNRITLLTNAISDNRTKVALSLPKGEANNKGSYSIVNSNKVNKNVQTIYMDDLLDVVNFTKAVLKIDVEGHEPEAFARAEKFFSKISIPLISMEFGQMKKNFHQHGSIGFKKVQGMIQFLSSKGYSVYGNNRKLDIKNWGSWPWDIKFTK